MHRRRRTSLSLLAVSVAATVGLGATPSGAAPAVGAVPALPGGEDLRRESGNGPDRNAVAATTPPSAAGTSAPSAQALGPAAAAPSAAETGYPRRTDLRVFPAVADASVKLGLIPYHELAPRLNALQAESDRVSVEVIGQSVQGRDLYLVTVTSPETDAQARHQERLRRTIEDDPVRAAQDPALLRDYKAPVLVNANIHGNEWEGTDGTLRVVEDLARSTDPAVGTMLDRTRFYTVLSVNPDGRVANTRANAAGFDMNRDYITASQPEVVATRQVIIDKQPLVFLDMHGYVAGTLIEPATAPHGQNYEYDLYLRQALPNAHGIQQALRTAVIPDALPGEVAPFIPFETLPPGEWDDWPPIFTPMYSIYHGAVGHTVEFPLRVNRDEYETLPEAELQRRARVNVAVTVETVRAGIAFTDANRDALVRDQIEVFRRGAAGEPRRDLALDPVVGVGPEDQGYVTQFPRAYVIPAVRDQRSPAAAARLVDHLVANDVRVTRADRAFRLAGRSYAAGSYVVDMHQPKRGLANVMLEAGRDVSDRVPTMYDIAGWSHRLLWGASVDVVRDGSLQVTGSPVVVAAPTGAVVAPAGSDLRLRLRDPRDVAAVNELGGRGVALRLTQQGAVVVPAAARAAAQDVAERYGVRFEAAPTGSGGPSFGRTVIAAAAASDELKALRDMGFDVRPVSTELLDSVPTALTGVDVLFVSSGLSYADLGQPARTAVDAFLRTGGLVTRGATGAQFNADTGMLSVTAVQGTTSANGVVEVVNTGGPVTSGALRNTFVYAPLWFDALSAGAVAEQTYETGDGIVAGHWVGDEATGPLAADGRASVVRGLDELGASVVLFGTEPMFRDHPKGLFAQVAKAVLHTSTTAATG